MSSQWHKQIIGLNSFDLCSCAADAAGRMWNRSTYLKLRTWNFFKNLRSMEFPQVIVGYEWASGSELGVIMRPNTSFQPEERRTNLSLLFVWRPQTGTMDGRRVLLFVCLELVNLMSGLGAENVWPNPSFAPLQIIIRRVDAAASSQFFYFLKKMNWASARQKVSFSTVSMPLEVDISFLFCFLKKSSKQIWRRADVLITFSSSPASSCCPAKRGRPLIYGDVLIGRA